MEQYARHCEGVGKPTDASELERVLLREKLDDWYQDVLREVQQVHRGSDLLHCTSVEKEPRVRWRVASMREHCVRSREPRNTHKGWYGTIGLRMSARRLVWLCGCQRVDYSSSS